MQKKTNDFRCNQADYSPRAKRREGGQQTRPISADVGRLFAVEEHSNERTGTNVSEETSSHGQGGFKKGKQIHFYTFCYCLPKITNAIMDF